MPDYNYWIDRWNNNQIGFHQEQVHKSLVNFCDHFSGHKTVFVPLCGKSKDMIYLRSKGFQVVGVEFSKSAILDFMKENNLELTVTHLNHFTLYQGHGFKIYQGDLFDLKAVDLGEVTACYDRASMVAFNRSERLRYSKFLSVVAQDLKLILSPLLDYGKITESAPPYSVTAEELLEFYGKLFKLEELSTESCPLRAVLAERGATYEREITWLFNRL